MNDEQNPKPQDGRVRQAVLEHQSPLVCYVTCEVPPTKMARVPPCVLRKKQGSGCLLGFGTCTRSRLCCAARCHMTACKEELPKQATKPADKSKLPAGSLLLLGRLLGRVLAVCFCWDVCWDNTCPNNRPGTENKY